jgi:hypothetical protein
MSGDSTRISVTVAVDPPLAFEIFTEDIDRWWRRGIKFRQSGARSGFLRIEPEVGGRLFESIDGDSSSHVFEVGRVRVCNLRPDHPARHGLQGGEFSRMIGLWWGEQLSSLREVCLARRS